MSKNHFTGGCLCGKITYSVEGPFDAIVNCHCSKCRKWHGSAFRTRLKANSAGFKWTAGESELSNYWSSEIIKKTFCRNCGSSLVSFYSNDSTIVGIPLGTLNEDPGKRPEFHIYVGSKAPWYEITDSLPQFETLPPK